MPETAEGVPVVGPDGKRYQFPSGTTKDQAIAYFKRKRIGVQAKSTESKESFWQGVSRKAGEESQRQMNLAVGPEAQKRGTMERLGHSAEAYGLGISQVGADIAGGFTDPKTWAALASGLIHPALPSLYFGAQGVKGTKESFESMLKSPTPDNVRSYFESLSMVAGSAAGLRGESPLAKVIDRSKIASTLREHAGRLDTKVLKQADAGKADFKQSSALQMAQEGIWGRMRMLPQAIEQVRVAKHAEVMAKAAQLDQQGVTINIAQDVRPVASSLMQRLNAEGKFTPQTKAAILRFIDQRLLTQYDAASGRWVPRNLSSIKVSDALKLTQGLEDTSAFGKNPPTEIQAASRMLRQSINDRVGGADPEIQRLRSEESKLIDDRTAARQNLENLLNDKYRSMRGVIYSGAGPVALWLALRGSGLMSMVGALGTVVALKALAESTPSRTLRAALYAKAADALDSRVRAVGGPTGASGAPQRGSALTQPNAPVSGGNAGVTPPARQLGTSPPFADAQVVFTNPPSAPSWSPGKTTAGLPESATRARSGSGNYVTPERQAVADAKANKPGVSPIAQAQEDIRRSVAQSNTKSEPTVPSKQAPTKAPAHDYKSLLSDALARRGSTKSGWETQSLEKQIAELTRAASGKATKEELKVINQHISARQRVTASRSAASQTTPVGSGVSSASGTSASGEAISAGMSPEQRSMLLEQGYQKLATYENGAQYVKALKEQAKLLSKDPSFDEVEALTGALEALRQLEGK